MGKKAKKKKINTKDFHLEVAEHRPNAKGPIRRRGLAIYQLKSCPRDPVRRGKNDKWHN